MDLADRIAKANENNWSNDSDIDEMGLIKREDMLTYFVARAIKHNYDERMSGKTTKLLHHRGDKLYLGNRMLSKNKATITDLCKPKRRLKDWEIVQIYDLLVEKTPVFDKNRLVVSDHFYWDIERGELMESDDPMLPVI